MEFDDHGKVIKKHTSGNDLGLRDTIVVEGDGEAPPTETLFGPDPDATPARSKPKKTKKKKARKR